MGKRLYRISNIDIEKDYQLPEVKDLLSVASATIKMEWIKKRGLPCVKKKNSIRIKGTDLVEFLKKSNYRLKKKRPIVSVGICKICKEEEHLIQRGMCRVCDNEDNIKSNKLSRQMDKYTDIHYVYNFLYSIVYTSYEDLYRYCKKRDSGKRIPKTVSTNVRSDISLAKSNNLYTHFHNHKYLKAVRKLAPELL